MPQCWPRRCTNIWGFTYAPDENHYWIHGYSTETDFIYVTTNSLVHSQIQTISEDVGPKRTLLICLQGLSRQGERIRESKPEKDSGYCLMHCAWEQDDYSLNIANLVQFRDPDPQNDHQQELFPQISEQV